MNLGRIILLASLAQILGLPALAAALSEQPALTKNAASASRDTNWMLSAPVAEVTLGSASHDRSSQAVLAVTALAETPLRHSVWMVAPAVRTVAVPRPRSFVLLRC